MALVAAACSSSASNIQGLDSSQRERRHRDSSCSSSRIVVVSKLEQGIPAAGSSKSFGILKDRRDFSSSSNFFLKIRHLQARQNNLGDEIFRWLSTQQKSDGKLDSYATWCMSLAVMISVMITPADAQAFVNTSTQRFLSDELVTINLFRNSTPSVVYITNLAVRRDAFTSDIMEVPQGSGSGFVWDKDGHIVTNYHVIRGASDLKITMGDQSTHEASIVGYDQDKDVAVLKIDASSNKTLRPLPLGNSSELLVGQKVFAIGNPFGLDHTLTTGVISGLRREITSAANGRPIQDVIQTDAAINPGNSGGPLLDSSGNLIGINTAIYSPSGASSGVGFSIPVDTVAGIVDQIIKYGKVTRPVLGISFAPDQSVEQLGVSGVLVLGASPDGPAGKAGLRSTTRDAYGRLVMGDIIVSMNGQKISKGSDLYKILDACKVGQTVNLEVLRGEETVTMTITLEARD
ncbi:protease Do-like 1, chloroplastic [Selaginella moellendorffii]|uniref:protease Do-like 1, chloroplastic n=1 Tax=Selaginella moellendorffii TaxID=88036 RepID=UPI000D1C8041|nr:protease Do-like 1, chloroplastic [Selaginella moellendorffii]|eukprot:XP_002973741.2 protease Do-like 1, chloroplastic [Selaginella moellendorffii]